MKNFSLSLTTRRDFDEQVSKLLIDNRDKSFYVNITSKKKEKRSLSANAQQHVWYKQISEFTDTDIKTCEAECKIDFGLPIVLADQEIGVIIDHALKNDNFYRMTREQQIKFIQIISVTSLMNTAQHNQYRSNIEFYWNSNGLHIEYKKNDK